MVLDLHDRFATRIPDPDLTLDVAHFARSGGQYGGLGRRMVVENLVRKKIQIKPKADWILDRGQKQNFFVEK